MLSPPIAGVTVPASFTRLPYATGFGPARSVTASAACARAGARTSATTAAAVRPRHRLAGTRACSLCEHGLLRRDVVERGRIDDPAANIGVIRAQPLDHERLVGHLSVRRLETERPGKLEAELRVIRRHALDDHDRLAASVGPGEHLDDQLPARSAALPVAAHRHRREAQAALARGAPATG